MSNNKEKVMISIVLEMKSLYHAVGRMIDQQTKTLDISGVQFFVLKFLMENENKDIYQKDIEKLLDVRRSTATAILQNLTHKGFLKRESSSNDARLKKIIISDKTKLLVKEFDEKMKMVENNIEKTLTDKEKETFSNIVEKIKDNLKK